MPKLLSVLPTVIALSACTALVLAQEAAPASPKLAAAAPEDETTPAAARQAVYPSETDKPARPTPTPKPKPAGAVPAPLVSPEAQASPTPKPRKPSWFQRLFGSRKPRPTPEPTPEATPTPVTHRNMRRPSATPEPAVGHFNAQGIPITPKPGRATPSPKATPTPKKTDKPTHPAKPETQPGATPEPQKPAASPSAEVVAPSTSVPPATTPAPKKGRKGKPVSTPSPKTENAPVEPPADADAETKEEFRFELAKSKALEDPEIASLKAKADNATTDDESRKDLVAYNKALFAKIRRIDSSVSERADRVEAAILKRLNE